jgi:hypothetical protein
MKFAKLTSLFALVTLVVLALGFASASFLITSSSSSQTANVGSQVSLTLNISPSGTHSGTLFNASLVLPNLFGSGTSWSGNSLFTVLNNTDVSKTVSVQVPTSQASGTYTGQIGLTGDYVLPSGQTSTIPSVTNLTVTVTVTSPNNIQVTVTGSEPSQSQPFTLNNNVTLAVSSSTVSGTATMSVVSPISGTNAFSPSLVQLQSTPVPVKVILKQLTGLKFGDQDVTVRATSGSQSGQATFQVRKTFCSAGTVAGNLTIDGVSWDNNGEGDENEWELLDEIEVEMDIRNNNNDDEVDAVAVLGLFDSNGNDVSDELVFIGDSRNDEEEIEISIDDDSEETVSWEFKVPADFDAGNYKLAVKVYDEDQGQSRDCADLSNDLDESFFQPIKIEQTDDEGRFVVVDEIELDTQLTCGQTVSGQFTVFNIGEDDEERVKITISNRDLGINLVREITSDLDQGEDETLDFSFTVPATARSGNYILEFFTEYDYDDGVYDQEADESTDYAIEVIGCSGNIGNPSGGLTNIAIDADLASDAKAGEELVIVATITNTGNEDAEFSISARGYSNWAELSDISPSTLSVDAGESEEVTLVMIVNKDASGMQSFDLQVSEDGRTQIQEIEVELASSSSIGGIFSSDNSLIWIIGAINLVLIILIIVVAVRMSRK